jgi:hypothetical protein
VLEQFCRLGGSDGLGVELTDRAWYEFDVNGGVGLYLAEGGKVAEDVQGEECNNA